MTNPPGLHPSNLGSHAILPPPLHAAAPTISQWLPAFHARLLQLVRAEVGWAGRVLPAHQPQIIGALLTSVFTKVRLVVSV